MSNFLAGFFSGRSSMTPEAPLLETQAPPPSFPKRRSMASAKPQQSLSKMFNQLPENLPNVREMQMDIMEFICHCMLVEINTEKAYEFSKQLEKATEGHQIPSHGRLCSRMRIATFLKDFVGIAVTSDDTLEADDPREYSIDVPSDTWNYHAEQLAHLKGLLLRKDANTFVPSQLQGYGEDEGILETKNDELNDDFGKHEMFQEPYKECITLLQVQKAIISLREEISDIAQNKGKGTKTTRLRKIVDEYERDIATIFFGQPVANPERKDLPQDLVDFLPDLPDRPGSKLTSIMGNMVDKMEAMLVGSGGEYSHGTLVKKIQSLLLQWEEVTLDTPVLFELGYGGVSAPIHDKTADDDISSMGDNKDGQLTPSKPEDVEERIKFQLVNSSAGTAEKQPRRAAVNDDAAMQQPNSPAGYTKQRYTLAQAPKTADAKAAAEKKRTYRHHFDDDSDVEETPTPLPKQKKARSSEESLGFMDTPAPGPKLKESDYLRRDGTPRALNRNGNLRKKRSFWSQVETQCVINGWMLYGKGKWNDIRLRYHPLLENRNPIAISDRYRTLVKNGTLSSGDPDDENWKTAHATFDESTDEMLKKAEEEHQRRRKEEADLRMARAASQEAPEHPLAPQAINANASDSDNGVKDDSCE